MRAVWRYPVLALVALGVLGIPNPARAQNAAAHSDEYNNFLELNIYGGYSDYKKSQAVWASRSRAAAILGGRVTENSGITSASNKSLNVYSWNKYHFLSNPAGRNVAPAAVSDPHCPARLRCRVALYAARPQVSAV